MKSIAFILIALASSPVAQARPEVTRKLLSSHDATAEFTGISEHKCLGRTSLCPDRCGDSGDLASFKIVKYNSYKKPGEYGDAKQENFQILIRDSKGTPKISEDTLRAILALKPGTVVHLVWKHNYVTIDGSSFPERVIHLVEPINQ